MSNYEEKLEAAKTFLAERKKDQPLKSQQLIKSRRSFAAAAINRLTASFEGTTASIDQELRSDLDKLRQRSRTMVQNNGYAKKFLNMCARHIAGPNGFIYQARVEDSPGKPDSAANSAIEKAIYEWSRRGVCEVTGRMSFPDLERAIIKCLATDGEALVRKVRGAPARNKFGFALQLLDVARLDTQLNRAPTNSYNAIIMGVEVDTYSRPVKYWLRKNNPGGGSGPGDHEQVPADDIIHLFLSDYAEQTRGIPWMHASMLGLHNIKGYIEAAVIAARVGAAKMGFFVTPDGKPPPLGDGDEEGEKEDAEFTTSAEPATFDVVPEGYDFRSYDPEYPHQQFPDFVKTGLRDVSSGFDVSYNGLANDLENVNFSSIRTGVLEERDQWMTLQNFFIEGFLENVTEELLPLALLNKAILMPNGSPLPFTKLEKFKAHIWQGRRWTWVDPEKDINAAIKAIKAGVSSPQKIAAQMGMDIEDVLSDIAAFEAMLKDKQVNLVDYSTAGDKPAIPSV